MKRYAMLSLGLGLAACLLISGSAAVVGAASVEFEDVEAQTLQFIDYYESIEMTPEQLAVRNAALEPLPAACCNDYSAATCCCKCNMSKSIWGLSNYLIAEQGQGPEEVRSKVQEWVAFINPDGFSGDTCFVAGGCMKAFKDGGCGGMKETHVNFD